MGFSKIGKMLFLGAHVWRRTLQTHGQPQQALGRPFLTGLRVDGTNSGIVRSRLRRSNGWKEILFEQQMGGIP